MKNIQNNIEKEIQINHPKNVKKIQINNIKNIKRVQFNNKKYEKDTN